MDILIQNSSPTPLFQSLNGNTNGTKGIAGRIVFEPDGAITKISEEVYLKKIKNNPFWKRLIEKGDLKVLNDVGIEPHAMMAESHASKELMYTRFKALCQMVESQGGAANPEIAQYLDMNGLPGDELVRVNMGGALDPFKTEELRKRYIAEKSENMLSPQLRFPGGKLASKSSHNIEATVQGIAEAKAEIKAAEITIYTREDLEQKSREELIGIAKDLKATIRSDAKASAIVDAIINKQSKN